TEALDRGAVRRDHRAPRDLEVDLVLVVEVTIERADRHAGALRDLGSSDRVVAVGAEQLGRRLDQAEVAAARALLAEVGLARGAEQRLRGAFRGGFRAPGGG